MFNVAESLVFEYNSTPLRVIYIVVPKFGTIDSRRETFLYLPDRMVRVTSDNISKSVECPWNTKRIL